VSASSNHTHEQEKLRRESPRAQTMAPGSSGTESPSSDRATMLAAQARGVAHADTATPSEGATPPQRQSSPWEHNYWSGHTVAPAHEAEESGGGDASGSGSGARTGAVSGALTPAVLNLLLLKPSTAEGDVEAGTERPPLVPSALPNPGAPHALSKEGLDVLRAERIARRMASVAALPGPRDEAAAADEVSGPADGVGRAELEAQTQTARSSRHGGGSRTKRATRHAKRASSQARSSR
jgi:hypothetical protein